MKLAGVLALSLAAVLGIWATTDYMHNEHAKQYNVLALEREVTREFAGASPSNDATDEAKRIESAERYDAIIGIVAACILIGSVVLFSQGKNQPTA
jgi:hypothetical protein